MANKPGSVFPSPFKFGFFAGIGFFCASVLMTLLMWICGALVLGGIGLGLLSKASSQSNATPSSPTVVQVSSARR